MTPAILWSAFDEQVTTDETHHLPTTVANIMETWTRNPGYPLIEVGKIPNRNSIQIEQVRNLAALKLLNFK